MSVTHYSALLTDTASNCCEIVVVKIECDLLMAEMETEMQEEVVQNPVLTRSKELIV